MLPILTAYIILVPAILGWGHATLNLLKRVCPLSGSFPGWALPGIAGLAVLSLMGTWLNFFLPVISLFAAGIVLIGMGLFILHHDEIMHKTGPVEVIIFLCLLLLSALLTSANSDFLFDTGVYHLQAVQWIQQSPVTLGLANLEGKLGFNTVWFPLAAILETALWSGKSTFLLSPLAIFFFLSSSVMSPRPALKDFPIFARLFLFLSAAPVIYFGWLSSHLTSLSFDLPVVVITLTVLALISAGFEEPGHRQSFFFLAVCLACFALTVKLTALPLLIGTCIVYAYSLLKDGSFSPGKETVLAGIGLLLLAPWIFRGILLSGCAFFPLPFACIDQLQWTVPVTTLSGETDVIRSWARKPLIESSAVLSDWHWFGPWLKKTLVTRHIRLVIVLFLAGLAMCLKVKDRNRPEKSSWLAALLISTAGIIFWFVTAPDPRLGYGYLAGAATLVFCFGWIRAGFHQTGPQRQRLLAFAFVGGLMLITAAHYHDRAVTWKTWPGIPHIEVELHQSGEQTIYSPKTGLACWQAPLPCTPFIRPDLKINSRENRLPGMFWYTRQMRNRLKQI